MNDELQNLISISNELGIDNSLVVGTGGNTSAKTTDGKYMYIKTSGTALKDMSDKYGWRRMKIESVLSIFNDKSLHHLKDADRELKIVDLLLSACDDNISEQIRPSSEATLHVILDRYVIHLHALAVLSYACAKNGKNELLELFKHEQYPPLWIPYADPGFSLSCKVFTETENYNKKYNKKPAIMILEKHGLLVANDNHKDALELVRKVINRCETKLPKYENYPLADSKQQNIDLAKENIKRVLTKIADQNIQITHFLDQTVAAFSTRKDAELLLSIPALTPDEMGFVYKPVVWLENCDYNTIVDKVNTVFSKDQNLPVGFLIKDAGLFIPGDSKFAEITREVIVGSLFVRMNTQNMGGINPLNKQQQNFIEKWEGEKFRVKIAKS